MNFLGRKEAPNLILNLLYLRDCTSYDRESYGNRLNKSQEAIEALLAVLDVNKYKLNL